MAKPLELTWQVEVDRLFEESRRRPVVVLKFSSRCGISAHTGGAFREWLAARPPGDPVLGAVVDVVVARAVSDELARRTGVRHETPQILVLRDGRTVWSASHWDADPAALDGVLAGGGA